MHVLSRTFYGADAGWCTGTMVKSDGLFTHLASGLFFLGTFLVVASQKASTCCKIWKKKKSLGRSLDFPGPVHKAQKGKSLMEKSQY